MASYGSVEGAQYFFHFLYFEFRKIDFITQKNRFIRLNTRRNRFFRLRTRKKIKFRLRSKKKIDRFDLELRKNAKKIIFDFMSENRFFWSYNSE